MRIVAISDTHNLHRRLALPAGDLLLHTGDVSKRGTKEEIFDFLRWFSEQPHPYKVFIAGNHDFYFEEHAETIDGIIPNNIIYLNENSIEIEGIQIFGSPYSPIPFQKWWAFNEHRGEDMQKHWDLIPENLDILMVHGPPMRILDMTTKKEAVGCTNLASTVAEKKPKYCIFGHIHEARGELKLNGTTYLNASSVDRYAKVVHPPIVFDY